MKHKDCIFKKLKRKNKAADKCKSSLRISIDSKAKVKVGDFARGGKSRQKDTPIGLDHDTLDAEKVVPFGILEVVAGALMIVMGISHETSDFIVDCLEQWWTKRHTAHKNIKTLVINLDNGPQNSGRRTQFLKRVLEFSQKYNLRIELVYYPPYCSKYNPIERCWGILECYWNGALLNSIRKIVLWASNMTWNGKHPTVELIDKIYSKGVTVCKKEFQNIESALRRDCDLPQYFITIKPSTV